VLSIASMPSAASQPVVTRIRPVSSRDLCSSHALAATHKIFSDRSAQSGAMPFAGKDCRRRRLCLYAEWSNDRTKPAPARYINPPSSRCYTLKSRPPMTDHRMADVVIDKRIRFSYDATGRLRMSVKRRARAFNPRIPPHGGSSAAGAQSARRRGTVQPNIGGLDYEEPK